jgi:hypothetical protein
MDPSRPVMRAFQADTQDSDLATAQTIATMCEHIRRAARDPLVQRTAQHAEASWGAARPSTIVAARFGLDGASVGPGCFWWAKHRVKVLRHSEFKALLAAYPEKRQLLVTPEVVLRAPNAAGDCSTFSMLIAAMLESLGVDWELVTVAVEPADPTLYSHVFVRAVLPDGRRITLDGSHGAYPGWEVPRAHQFRRQVWDSTGEPIDDEAPVVSQLHEYRRRGLGDTYWDAEGNLVDTSAGSSVTDLSSAFSEITSNVPNQSGAYTPIPASGAVAPSGGTNTAAWAAFAGALTAATKGAMTLTEINAIQPGTVVGANGQILRQATGLPVPVGTGITAAIGSSSSVLIIGGLIAAGLLFFVMSNKR